MFRSIRERRTYGIAWQWKKDAGRRRSVSFAMKEFFRAGSFVFVGLIASNVLTYVYYATVSRSVGVDAAGLFMSLVSAILIASLPSSVLSYVIVKTAADAKAQGRGGDITALGTYSSYAIVPVLAVTMIALLLWTSSLRGFFHVDDTTIVVFAGLCFALNVVLLLQRAVLQGAARFGSFVASNAIEAVIKAASGVACFAWHGSVRVALGGYVVAAASAAGFNAAQTSRGEAATRPRLERATAVRHMLGIAMPTAALTAVTFADVVLVRHALSPYDSGLYGATALFGRALLTALQFVPTVLLPKAAAEHAVGRSAARFLLAAVGATMAAVVAALLLAAFFPDSLLTVVAGRAFVAAAPLVLPYTLAMSALAGATVLTSYLIALNRIGFSVPLVLCAVAEVVAIILYHPSPAAVVRVVLIGHCALLVCCLFDVLLSLRPGISRRAASAPPDRR